MPCFGWLITIDSYEFQNISWDISPFSYRKPKVLHPVMVARRAESQLSCAGAWFGKRIQWIVFGSLKIFWLVVWNMIFMFIFHHIGQCLEHDLVYVYGLYWFGNLIIFVHWFGNFIIPTVWTLIFFRGRFQPPTRSLLEGQSIFFLQRLMQSSTPFVWADSFNLGKL